jgi:hypothetical protein
MFLTSSVKIYNIIEAIRSGQNNSVQFEISYFDPVCRSHLVCIGGKFGLVLAVLYFPDYTIRVGPSSDKVSAFLFYDPCTPANALA